MDPRRNHAPQANTALLSANPAQRGHAQREPTPSVALEVVVLPVPEVPTALQLPMPLRRVLRVRIIYIQTRPYPVVVLPAPLEASANLLLLGHSHVYQAPTPQETQLAARHALLVPSVAVVVVCRLPALLEHTAPPQVVPPPFNAP